MPLASCYARRGTGLAYAAMRCAVLTSRMLLSGANHNVFSHSSRLLQFSPGMLLPYAASCPRDVRY
eukprot:1372005-Rhodomonas_salina.3